MLFWQSKFFWFLIAASGVVFLFWGFKIDEREIIIARNTTTSSIVIDAPTNLASKKTDESDEAKIIPLISDAIKELFIKDEPQNTPLPTPINQPINQRLNEIPAEIRGIYITSWVAGIPERINYLLKIIEKNNLNAVVIDIKDFSGYLAFKANLQETKEIEAEQNRIPDFNALINKLHNKNIYVVARISVFQDTLLAHKMPELAVKSKKTKGVWLDRKGLSWIDPSAKPAWQYIAKISEKVASYGVDELNFDYIRFPSDGNMADLSYPFWDGKTPEKEIIKNFFAFLDNELSPLTYPAPSEVYATDTAPLKLSADLFGLTTINYDDLGIGQVLENAAPYFNYLCPMVYPSHYASGFLGYKNPANYPYEVVSYSVKSAEDRLSKLEQKCQDRLKNATTTPTQSSATACKTAKLRPWLQVFDLGAVYTSNMINLEIKAVKDAGFGDGYYLWDPSNLYYNLKIATSAIL